MDRLLNATPAEREQFRRCDPETQIAQLRGQRIDRVFTVERHNGIDEKARTAWLSIASDEPYARWWGIEILDMQSKSIRADRLKQGAPLLVGHDTADQIGVIEKHEITADKRLRILARFGRSARAEEIWQDVLDGIRRNTSVGYVIHELVLEKQDKDSNTYRVTDWEPLEGSLVAVPADPTVGVGRADISTQSKGQFMKPEIEPKPAATDQGAAEAHRVSEIRALAKVFPQHCSPETVERYVNAGYSAEACKALILESMRDKQTPATPTAEPFSSPYGEGARMNMRHGSLSCFTGKDGARQAYAFGQWLRQQAPGQDAAKRWCQENGMALTRYLNGDTSTEGGYLVPGELAAEVIKNMDLHGVFRKEARVWPMSSDSLSIPKRTGGITAAFLQNDTEATASDPAFGSVNLLAKEVIAKTHVTRALMEDSAIDLGDYVGQEMAEAFALLEDQCGFLGTGTSAYGGMQGINPKLLAATASCLTAASNHDTAPEIDATDLANLMALLPQYADKGAKFYMSKAFYGAIIQRLLIAAGGNNIRTLEAGSSANPAFAGYEVVLTPVLPASSSTDYSAAVMMLFGNLRKSSAFGDRRAISMLLDPYTLAGKSQIRIIGGERFTIVNHDVGDTSTTGPVVALLGQ